MLLGREGKQGEQRVESEDLGVERLLARIDAEMFCEPLPGSYLFFVVAGPLYENLFWMVLNLNWNNWNALFISHPRDLSWGDLMICYLS